MKITLNNLKLNIDDKTIPSQYSSNVPVTFVNDKMYNGYVSTAQIKYTEGYKIIQRTLNISGGVFYLPYEALANEGMLELSIMNTKGNTSINSQPLHLKVTGAPYGSNILPSDASTWESYVSGYIDSYVAYMEAEIQELNDKVVYLTDAMIKNTVSGEGLVQIEDGSNMEIHKLTVHGQSVQNGTPTPSAPVDIESLVVSEMFVTGKNLLKNGAVSSSNGGVTFTVNEDKSITCNGSTTTDYALCNMLTVYELPKQFKKGSTYAFIGAKANVPVQIYERQESSWVLNTVCTTEKHEFTISENAQGLLIRIAISAGKTVSKETIYPMIVAVPCEDYEYEKYKDIVTTEIDAVLNSLPNGVCDTLDNNVITRRAGVVTFNGNETWSQNTGWETDGIAAFYYALSGREDRSYAISDNFETRAFVDCMESNIITKEALRYDSSAIYIFIKESRLSTVDVAGFKAWLQSHPVTVCYELATPTTEEVDVDATHTFYPHTNVYVESNLAAQIDVTYIADTKLYIENRLESAA